MAKREFLMLAHTYRGDEPIGGWFWSEKLDGMRAFWDGGLTRGMRAADVPFANIEKDGRYVEPPKATGLWTRYGKPVQAPEWWLDKMPAFPVDGELFMGRGKFQDLISATKRLIPGPEWLSVNYMAFDAPPYHAVFANGEMDNVNFKKSFRNIAAWIGGREYERPARGWHFDSVYDFLRERAGRNEVFHALHQSQLPFNTQGARDQVSAILDKLLAGGAEGIMLRHPGSLWAPQRSRQLLKVKGMQDAEAVVTGYVWGRETDKGSKLLGRMGALVVEFRGKRLELSGFTDEERVLCMYEGADHGHDLVFAIGCANPGLVVQPDIHNPRFPLGSTVTFRYRELTDAGIPKEARYWRKHELSF
jgi:DNA ligase-1